VTDQIAGLARRVGAQAAIVAEAAAPVFGARSRAPNRTRRALNTIVALLGVLDDLVFQATERLTVEQPVESG
jgi:hypothetical protein